MTSPESLGDDQAALRADIRRLGNLLGESLVRQEGPDLLALVERVRGLSRGEPRGGAGPRRAPRGGGRRDRGTAGPGVRDVLPPGQRHRAGAPRPGHARGASRHRWLARAGRGPHPGGRAPCEEVRELRRAARRAPGLHRPPDRGRTPLGPGQAPPGGRAARQRATGDGRRTDRRLAEIIDLLWQTDELRLDRPEPLDEARNAVYYLDELMPRTVARRARGARRRARRAGRRRCRRRRGRSGSAPGSAATATATRT